MMSDKTRAETEKLVQAIRKSYEFRTYTKLMCKLIEYDSKTDKQFTQIPIRIQMELGDFKGAINNEPLGRDLGEELTSGEFVYITKELSKAPKSGTIKEFNNEFLVELLRKLPSEFQPVFILIPIDSELYHHMYKLVDTGIAKYETDGLFLNIADYRIKVIWSSNLRPFENVYLIGKDSISWTFKTNKNMKKIPNLEDYKADFNKELSKVSAIYKTFNGNKIDFVFRVVGLVEIDKKRIRKYSIEGYKTEKMKSRK